MSQPQARVLPKWPLLLILTLLGANAWAHSDDLITIDPNAYPGAYYRIVLDHDGDYVTGDGDGYGGWQYYPDTGWYRMWFYNDPYDSDREAFLFYRAFITANDYARSVSFDVRFNWTKPAWSALGRSHPPLPDDAPTGADEIKYMENRTLQALDGVFLGSPDAPGSVEPQKSCIVSGYNPEWVSVDVKGRNVDVHRGVYHECRLKPGACYESTTRDCSIEYEEDCLEPYMWLGPGTTCSDTSGSTTSQLDFGDAPESYGTTAGANGPRHKIVSGVRLGGAIDNETDGKPSLDALGDDATRTDDEDGVVFTTTLSPGDAATVEVTASVQGYLNAWVDFDGDGTFDGRDEQIFTDARLAVGVNSLSFTIPAAAVTGDTYARFRFNTRGLLAYYGLAQDGEVEDYKVSIVRGFEPQPNTGKGGLKWSQPPQSLDAATPFIFNGWDEMSALHLHQIVADDWQCSDEQPITGFQWWGSFAGWTKPMLPAEQPLGFHIGIWTDVPGTGGTAGHPGTLIWENYCTYWTWNLAGYDHDPQGTMQDETCFQFTTLLSQDQWFYQSPDTDASGKSVPTVYWLTISAVYDTGRTPVNPWGWTTRPYSFNSAASRIGQISFGGSTESSWPPAIGSQWLSGESIEEPRGTKWDLAFELLTNQGDEGTGSNSGVTVDPSPVYRFWSESLTTHFYTVSESEKDALIRDWPAVWSYEGIAFYAYPPDVEVAGAKPVYRFWSGSLGRHFYTMSESERDDYIRNQSKVWSFEGVAWNAFDRTVATQ